MASGVAGEAGFETGARPLLQEFCVRCHGADRAKAGVDLERFRTADSVYREPVLWESVFRQLRDRAMPPSDQPQPSETQRQQLLAWAEEVVANADERFVPKDPGHTVLRRLTWSEYNRTVQDLFHVSLRPADRFPADGGGGGGFDNNASTLFVPPILMEQLLEAAREVVGAAPTERVFVVRPGLLRSEPAAARRIFEQHTGRAFRRLPAPEEIQGQLAAFAKWRRDGLGFEDSVRRVLTGLLVSPSFLYRVEGAPTGEGPQPVGEFALASRLSYFLWSTMPDDRLLALARGGRLSRPRVLESEVNRMLGDPRARAFCEDFVGQWLNTRNLKTTVHPDPQRFPGYTPELRDAMVAEPVEMFHAVLTGGGSLLQLLDAEFTFANEVLAQHYGLTGVRGRDFRRVALPDRNRGGVLGMAGVLTLTSYPLRTSPVLRGKWVLEELLGTPPPPPPPLVASLPPDDALHEGLTFRQRLEQHRKDPKCASCHQKMDPLGFGLEEFDAIGAWRTESGGRPVDATGVLPEGRTFQGAVGLKQVLLEQRRQFALNLTRRLLSYALGRGLEYYDQPAVRRIVAALENDDYRARTLVLGVVRSYPFLHTRGAGPDNQSSTR